MARSYNMKMTTDPSPAHESFVDKWRARWPEWTVAEVFLPTEQRVVAVAWFALLQEFADAAWGGSDAAPGLAKLAWWQEELRGWAKGARRHPLGEVLQPRPADWNALADAMPVLRHRELPADPGGAVAAMAAFGQAAAQMETSVFDAGSTPGTASMAMLAAPVAAAGGTNAAGALLARWSMPSAQARPVRLLDRIVRLRLQAVAAGRPWQPAARWRVLWALWRAARN